MYTFDVLIIGGGPGGYLAAERAAQGGLKTVLFEKNNLGGVCLNEGCVPSKTLLNSAKHYDYALHGENFGVTAENVQLNQAAVIRRKQTVVKTLVSGVSAKMKAHKVTVIKEAAVISGKSNDGFIVKAGGDTYTGQKLIIASGSESLIPPIPGVKEGLESGFVLTNREILNLEQLPDRLTIIGGGVIGLEMAAYFQTVGTKVTVVEMMDKIAGPTDGEITALLKTEMEKKGTAFLLGCRVSGITKNAVQYEQDGKVHMIEADKVLLCIGRGAVTRDLGLENLGLYIERGAIVTDEHLRTNISGVYAVGDVNGKIPLAHTAYREAEAAVNHILGKADYMRYEAVPSVIYTMPEVAGVGETEQSVKDKGFDVDIVRVSALYSGRFVAETNSEDGLCKLLVEKGSRRLLGVHLMCPYASEMIYGAALMLELHMPAEEIKELVFPHPTVGEIIREGLFMV